MTPRQRADKLLIEFSSVSEELNYDTMYMSDMMVAQCALICVDQIILEQCKSSELKDAKYQDERIKYWNEVKQILEKL